MLFRQNIYHNNICASAAHYMLIDVHVCANCLCSCMDIIISGYCGGMHAGPVALYMHKSKCQCMELHSTLDIRSIPALFTKWSIPIVLCSVHHSNPEKAVPSTTCKPREKSMQVDFFNLRSVALSYCQS